MLDNKEVMRKANIALANTKSVRSEFTEFIKTNKMEEANETIQKELIRINESLK